MISIYLKDSEDTKPSKTGSAELLCWKIKYVEINESKGRLNKNKQSPGQNACV